VRAKYFAQCRHALTRAFERYGLLLTFGDLRDLARAVAGGRARHVRDNVWRLEWRGRWLRLVYSLETDAIVTFLPP
jgi:hypothetical protein